MIKDRFNVASVRAPGCARFHGHLERPLIEGEAAVRLGEIIQPYQWNLTELEINREGGPRCVRIQRDLRPCLAYTQRPAFHPDIRHETFGKPLAVVRLMATNCTRSASTLTFGFRLKSR